jgi:hypothetical protein
MDLNNTFEGAPAYLPSINGWVGSIYLVRQAKDYEIKNNPDLVQYPQVDKLNLYHLLVDALPDRLAVDFHRRNS